MDELYHYGIKGQRWGVRRYLKKDGSLTISGKRKFKDVSKDKHARKIQTRQAVKILNDDSKKLQKQQNKLDKKIDRLSNKKETEKTKIKLDKLKSIKEKVNSDSNLVSKKLNDISSGTIKAGKDFIVNSKHYKVPVVYIGLTGPKIRVNEVHGRNRLIMKQEANNV